MFTERATQLDTYLDRVVNHIQQIRKLDLSEDAGFEQALAQSREVMGALALYRRHLERAESYATHSLLQAA